MAERVTNMVATTDLIVGVFISTFLGVSMMLVCHDA